MYSLIVHNPSYYVFMHVIVNGVIGRRRMYNEWKGENSSLGSDVSGSFIKRTIRNRYMSLGRFELPASRNRTEPQRDDLTTNRQGPKAQILSR